MKPNIKSIKDDYQSIFTGVISGSLYFGIFRDQNMPSSLDNLFLGGITVCTGLAGFLIASMSIIFSLEEKYIIKQLRKTKLYNKLIKCFVDAVRWNFSSLIIGLLGLFINFEFYHKWHNLFFAFWLFIIVVALCTSYRVVDVLQKTLTAKKESEA